MSNKPQFEDGFIPNQGYWQRLPGMRQDQELKTGHHHEKNMLEHQKDDQIKHEMQQIKQMHGVIKSKFEFILTLQDGISNLIEKTKSPTQ